MIAYLFWHWPSGSGEGAPDAYEEGLVAFHRRLLAAGVPGLAASATYRVAGLPWLEAERGYEDWYLVGGFGDLEALNREAVGPTLLAYHDRPAAAAAGGGGGRYRVTAGGAAGVEAGAGGAGGLDLAAAAVTWISKPSGQAYPAFLGALPAVPWLLQRQLTLGPTPEFCAGAAMSGGLASARELVFSGTV